MRPKVSYFPVRDQIGGYRVCVLVGRDIFHLGRGVGQTRLSLFSGVGGLDLAFEWAGGTVAAMCEIDPFCRRVLRKHWPDVPLFGDVREMRGADVGTVDVIYGGYPCQPFSSAGSRRGEKDPRHLWPHFMRLVGELRPAWVVGENVVGHISLGLDAVLHDLESAAYTARAFCIPAGAVGAPHRRHRVFVVAHDDRKRELQPKGIVPNIWERPSHGLGWLSEPDVDRVVYGVPDGVERRKALGNAVVPQQAYPIFRAIAEVEG